MKRARLRKRNLTAQTSTPMLAPSGESLSLLFEMDKDKFNRQIESMWKHRDTDEQKRLVKYAIAKTMRLTLTYPELAQEYYDSLCKVIPDNEPRITLS